MAALPYLRVYCADWDADTQHLTAMQDGIYWRLVRNYWQRGGPLPADEKRLARIAGVSLRDWRNNCAEIAEFFTVGKTQWHHNRLQVELSRVAAKSLNNKRPGNANAKRTQRDLNTIETRTPIYTDTDNTLGKPNGGKPPEIDPVKQLFDLGVSLLTDAGVSDKQARSLIGKYRKARSDGEVLTALLECRAQAISEPVEWLEKRLKPAKYKSASGFEYRGSLQEIRRLAEKRADWTTFHLVERELRGAN